MGLKKLLSWPAVVWSVIGLSFAAIILANVADPFSSQVEVGQDMATLLAIRGTPTEKYLERDSVHGRYVAGAPVLVYRYHVPGPGAGDIKFYIKNGKVVGQSIP